MTPQQIRDAFLKTFNSEDGKIVLAHLADFAYAENFPFCDDARKAAYLVGRRSLYYLIIKTIQGEK